MSGWQPIETAPHDGTPILLARDGGFVGIGFIRDHRMCDLDLRDTPAAWIGVDEWTKRPRVSLGGWDADEATHWMPLPEPPPSERGSGD
jgi:hypothetical protein